MEADCIFAQSRLKDVASDPCLVFSLTLDRKHDFFKLYMPPVLGKLNPVPGLYGFIFNTMVEMSALPLCPSLCFSQKDERTFFLCFVYTGHPNKRKRYYDANNCICMGSP